MNAWIRRLEVTLTSNLLKKKMTFGTNHLNGKDDLSLEIVGHKYMSVLKDECTIKIKNLTMSEVVQIIEGQFYDVEIKVGYRLSTLFTIFDGGVLYVSNEIDDRKTNTVILLCSNKFVAKYGQSRINLTMNSGINLYSAINFVCKRAGVPNTNVSTEFKKKFIDSIELTTTSVGTYIDELCKNNQNYIVNGDSSTPGASMTLFDAAKSANRIIVLRDDNIILQQYPQLDTNGLSLTVMPTFNFTCGDTIRIDNSIINIPVKDKSEISKNYGYFLDKDGDYVVYQVKYSLQNRGSDFAVQLLCKSKNLILNLVEKL